MSVSLKNIYAEEKAASTYEQILKLVAAVNCDYERLHELGEDRIDSWLADEPEDCPGFRSDLQTMVKRDSKEWQFLKEQANGCENHEEALKRIHYAAEYVKVRSDWTDPNESLNANQFRIVLCSSDPAIQIRGELNDGEPTSHIWLEYQSDGKGWTHLANADEETLLCFSLCFNFCE